MVSSGHSKRSPKTCCQDDHRLMQFKGIEECSAILPTFVKLPSVIKTFNLSIFE